MTSNVQRLPARRQPAPRTSEVSKRERSRQPAVLADVGPEGGWPPRGPPSNVDDLRRRMTGQESSALGTVAMSGARRNPTNSSPELTHDRRMLTWTYFSMRKESLRTNAARWSQRRSIPISANVQRLPARRQPAPRFSEVSARERSRQPAVLAEVGPRGRMAEPGAALERLMTCGDG